MNTINWQLVWKLALQGVALAGLTTLVAWSGGAAWETAVKSGVGVAAGWLVGNLQQTGGVIPQLSALKKDKGV